MTRTTHEIWRERVSGRIWVIELTRGRMVGCCGPLTPEDLAGVNLSDLTFERDRDVLRILRVRRDQFVRWPSGEEAT